MACGAYQARPPLGYKVVEHGKPPVIVPEEENCSDYI